jgi:serine/threonine-protein kinase ULK2
MLQREINILRMINSPNVVKLYGEVKIPLNGDYLLLLEFCNGGNLREFIKARRKPILPEEQAHFFLLQIVRAIQDHSAVKVVHRDLKLVNIGLKIESERFNNEEARNKFIENLDFEKDRHKLRVKMIDYGLARILLEEDLATTQVGTPVYAAPEVLEGREYTSSADVWSVGVLFFEMLTGYQPFNKATRT